MIFHTLYFFVSIQPSCRRCSNIPCCVDCFCRNEHLITNFRMAYLTVNYEFHAAFHYNDKFIRIVNKINPLPLRRLYPDIATEPTGIPVYRNLINGWNSQAELLVCRFPLNNACLHQIFKHIGNRFIKIINGYCGIS